MKRASYRDGVAFIAYNDEPAEMDPDVVRIFISVGLLAALFDVSQEMVAKDVVALRKREPA